MHHRVLVWLTVAIFSLLVIVNVVGTASYFVSRSHDNCTSRQRLYDGQVTLVRFLAREFHATPAQVTSGLDDLYRALGPRPKC